MDQLTPEQEAKYWKSKLIWHRVKMIVGGLIIAVLIFYLIRGCQNEKAANIAYDRIEEALKNTLKQDKRIRDSAENLEKEKAALDSTVADLIADRDMMQAALIDDSDKIKRLSNEVKKAKASRDTARYIEKCDSLAEESAKKDEFLKKAWEQVARVDNARILQINNLTQQRDLWRKGYDSCINAVKKVDSLLPQIKPRRKLYIDGAVKFGAITGAGGGLSYIDKKGNKFSGKAYATNVGPVYEAGYGRLLGFKRK